MTSVVTRLGVYEAIAFELLMTIEPARAIRLANRNSLTEPDNRVVSDALRSAILVELIERGRNQTGTFCVEQQRRRDLIVRDVGATGLDGSSLDDPLDYGKDVGVFPS